MHTGTTQRGYGQEARHSDDAGASLHRYSMGEKIIQSDTDDGKLMFETAFILSDIDQRPFDDGYRFLVLLEPWKDQRILNRLSNLFRAEKRSLSILPSAQKDSGFIKFKNILKNRNAVRIGENTFLNLRICYQELKEIPRKIFLP